MSSNMRSPKPMVGFVVASVICVMILASGCSSGKNAEKSVAATAAEISVTVKNPEIKSVQGALTLNGTIRAENEVDVIAETSGKVTKVLADMGTRISKGDVVVQIDDELKQASYRTALAAYEKNKSDWGKAQDLFAQKVISDSELQSSKLAYATSESQLLSAKRDFDNAKVRSPLSGIISQRIASVGSMLAPGASVAHVIDTDNLKLTVRVSERDILKVKKNMTVSIESDMYPDVAFKGTVFAVSPKGDGTLTFPVEISVKSDANRPLYDGMSASAIVNLGKKSILAVPRVSIVGTRDAPQVFVVSNKTAHLVNVVTGNEYGTDIEILKGLSVSDQVVFVGQNNLNDGVSVIVTEEGAQ